MKICAVGEFLKNILIMIKQDNFSLQKNCNIEEPLISELQPNLQLMSGKAQKSQGDKSADPGGNLVSMRIS